MIYLEKIREEASAAYSAGAAGYSSLGGDVPFTCIIGVCPMKPEKSDMAIGIMNDEVTKMTKTVDAEMLSKVKELMLKRADENVRRITTGWALSRASTSTELTQTPTTRRL